MVRAEELQTWAEMVCDELGLPTCETMFHIRMIDDYVGITGENDGGCMVIYEMDNPKHYCITVEKSVLQNRQVIKETLERQLTRYKEFIEENKM